MSDSGRQRRVTICVPNRPPDRNHGETPARPQGHRHDPGAGQRPHGLELRGVVKPRALPCGRNTGSPVEVFLVTAWLRCVTTTSYAPCRLVRQRLWSLTEDARWWQRPYL